MPNKINIRLGVKQLSDLSTQLKAYKKHIDGVGDKIVTEMVATGSAELTRNLASIPNFDGNDVGSVEAYVLKNVGVISQYGPQVVYLEFGTGIPGESVQHPQASDIGWEYNTKTSEHAHRIINGVEGWFYKPDGADKAIFTPGIRGSMSMWNTALFLRRYQSVITKKIIKDMR